MSREAYRWLSRLTVHCRFWLVLSVFLGILNGIFIISQAYILAFIINQVVIHQVTRASLMQSMWLLVISFIMRAIFAWIREIVQCKSAITVKENLYERLIKHIYCVGPVRLAAFQGGALSTIMMEQIESIHAFYANYLPQMVLVAVLPILILIVVFPSSWIAGLLLLLTAPLIPLFMAFVGMGAESKAQKQSQQMAKMSGHFLDVLRGLVTLKLFNSSRTYLQQIKTISDTYRKNTMQVLRIAFLSSAVLELFSSVAIAMLAVYLGLGLLSLVHAGFPHGIVTLQNALFILLLAPEFFLPLRQLGTHYHARAEAIGAAKEIYKILELPILHSKKRSKKLEQTHAISIIFDHVNFGYDPNKLILKNFNFIARPGEHKVIVGESGSGKSTILNLINVFLVPISGAIRVNNQDLQILNPETWRESIAWIGQNTRLFYGTLRDNLQIAKPNASDAEIFYALKIAYLDDFIASLPQGLETTIGEQNQGFSQGQIQRLALARAYLKNAPVLLLDEATANLDQESEQVILSAIKTMSKEKTVISVSHREQAIASAHVAMHLETVTA